MSFWINTKRVARYGFIGFVRNGFISLAAVFILTITLFFLANLMISNAAMKATLEQLSEQVDVTVYFLPNANVADIENIQAALVALPEVAEVKYTTREEALADFRERHKNDQLTLQALDELGENPLGASLEVRAKETSQYESVANFLDNKQKADGAASPIDKVNFAQNKAAIDRLTNIIDASSRNGIAKELILGICAILIAFNTIRLAIYTARDEIGVMNLVGASHWYVRGPFLMAGVLYGVASALIVLVFLFPILYYHPVLIGLDPTAELLFGSFDSFGYFVSNFLLFFGALIGVGVGLGVLSSYLAVRRYLKA